MTKLLSEMIPILFLDDEINVLNAIERELREYFEIKTTTSPTEAIQIVRSTELCGIVSDLTLPDSNGIQFLKECSLIKPEVPRMLLTAFSDLLNIEDTINNAQIFRLMAKPWKKENLIQSLEAMQKQYDLFQENQVLRTLSLTDSLTGLANHRYFWERLESEFSRAKRFKRSLSLIMADVDDFKKINDTEGHPKGDFILKKIAHILNTEKRNMDTIARYGGEEFAMILPEASAKQASEIARRRLEVLQKANSPTLSFGVAELDSSCDSSKTLFERADKALYRAKALGKACVEIWRL
jgi:two-component system cell cycle response regulator